MERRGSGPLPPCRPPSLPAPTKWIPRAYSHDRYMLLYTVINSTDRHVHQPPNPSKLSPSRPSPSPSRARLACARSHGRRALHTVLVAQACCNRPSIPACCRLIVHPLSANESDITSQVSYANGLSDIAPPTIPSGKHHHPSARGRRRCYPCPAVEAQCHNVVVAKPTTHKDHMAPGSCTPLPPESPSLPTGFGLAGSPFVGIRRLSSVAAAPARAEA